jgi:hypothetical protein
MSTRQSALLALTDNVRTWLQQPYVQQYITSLGVYPPVVTTTGWAQRQQVLNQGPGQANRICFMPGLQNGDQGQLHQPRHRQPYGGGRTQQAPPGGRVLFTWDRSITVSIWACDTTQSPSTVAEEAQIEASDNLLQLTVEAIQACSGADWVPVRIRKDPGTVNVTFGIELLLECIHHESLLDVPEGLVMGATPALSKVPAA